MKILVACEFSGVVRDAFAALGHDAWSCDLLPSETPGNHIQGDVREVLNKGWCLIVGHPPCTYLSNSGVRHLHSIPSRRGVVTKVHGKERWGMMIKAAKFFREILEAPATRIAVENPVPHRYAVLEIGRQYNQVIQPWMFGHGETKATCLWLRGLPLLTPTHFDNDLFAPPTPTERTHRVHLMTPSPNRWRERSRTLPGIAKAMAAQWGAIAALLFAITANAASVGFEWTASPTPGATNRFYLSRSPLTNLTTAPYRYDVGTRTNVSATLTPGVWYLAVTARTEIESDPAHLIVIVPQPVTQLREVVVKGHQRQRQLKAK